MNSTTYITYDASSTGDATTYFASVNGGAFVAIPAATSTALAIESGQTLVLRQTASSTPATARNLVINIGDADGSPRQQTTYTVTSVSTPFPSTTFTPTSPNAAPATIVPFTDPVLSVTLNGTASVSSSGNTWSAGGTTLTGSNILVNIASGGFVASGAIANGQSLAVAWDVSYLNTLAHDANASGTISGTISGTTYTTPFSFQVKKSPTFTIPTGTTGVVTGSTINTGTLTVDGYNCPVTVSISAPTTASTATMTAGKYALNGGTLTAVSVPGTFTIYPSQTLLIEGTVDSTVGGYNGLTVTIGSAPAQEWRVRNATAVPAIATPSITSPSGSPPTLLNPALNSPAGITLQGDQYTPSGGASATQTSSTWEVYKANLVNPETSAITAVNSTPSSIGGMAWSAALNTEPVWSNYSVATFDFGAAWNPTTSLFINSVTNAGTNISLGIWDSSSPTGPWTRSGSFSIATAPSTAIIGNRYVRFSLYGGANVSTGVIDQTGGSYTVTQLTLTDATDLASMQVGDSVVEVGGGADATGTITAINSATAPYTLTLYPTTGTWNTTATAKDTSRTITHIQYSGACDSGCLSQGGVGSCIGIG